MININKFISIRKKLGLSQTELCNGICTQSTLSKFENNGRIPSLKILNSLCDRLNINVADIMDADSNKKTSHKLFEADFAVIQLDFPKVAQILASINKDELTRQEDVLHYFYLRGLLIMLRLMLCITSIQFLMQTCQNRIRSIIFLHLKVVVKSMIYKMMLTKLAITMTSSSPQYPMFSSMMKTHYYNFFLFYVMAANFMAETKIMNSQTNY